VLLLLFTLLKASRPVFSSLLVQSLGGYHPESCNDLEPKGTTTRRTTRQRRVMFSNVTTPLDGPAQHTRSVSRSADPLSTYGAVFDDHSSSSATICSTGSDESSSQVRSTIAPEPASLAVPRRSERLSQPLERYSPGLFFMDAGEPMTY
jgi:hypothetical protein